MSQTLRREIIQKVRPVLEESFGSYHTEDVIRETAEKIADALADLRAFKPKDIGMPVGLEWKILGGMEITEEDQSEEAILKESRDEFEKAFGFNPPWFSNKDWTAFAAFVGRVYRQDKETRTLPGNIWLDYCQWRETDGKYNGKMTNFAIRKDPKSFMDTGHPTFEARKMYWHPVYPVQSSDQETSGDGEIYV